EGDSGCSGYELLDGTRPYIPRSTGISSERTNQYDDGPYGIQDPPVFFALNFCPLNPEVGSIGTPAVGSIQRMMSAADYNDFPRDQTWNATWRQHTYIPYANQEQNQPVKCSSTPPTPVYDQIAAYGELSKIEEFCFRAQLTNYMQYKALFEGISSHMWQWYAGIFVWKSQNPWTGLRGQLYDWYLDQTAGFYGTSTHRRFALSIIPLHRSLISPHWLCFTTSRAPSFTRCIVGFRCRRRPSTRGTLLTG